MMTRSFVRLFAFAWLGTLGCAKAGISDRPDLALPTLVALNSASYVGAPAASSQATAFGAGLAEMLLASSGEPPLPTNLAGVSLAFVNGNREYLAPLFFVSPSQINFVVPDEAKGLMGGQIAVRRDGVAVATIGYDDPTVNPGIYTTNSSGVGCPLGAYTLYVTGEQAVVYAGNEPCKKNPTTGVSEFSPIKISGPNNEVVFLALEGTGIRRHTMTADALKATVGSIAVDVLYAGPHGDAKQSALGKDQINISLPKDKLMRGDYTIVIEADGKKTNAVRITVAQS